MEVISCLPLDHKGSQQQDKLHEVMEIKEHAIEWQMGRQEHQKTDRFKNSWDWMKNANKHTWTYDMVLGGNFVAVNA